MCPARIRLDVNAPYIHRFSLTAVYGCRIQGVWINARMCSYSARFTELEKGANDLICTATIILGDSLAETSSCIFHSVFRPDTRAYWNLGLQMIKM